MLDCRGVLQQFARDFKTDLTALASGQAAAMFVTSKLIETDALGSDIIQHHYQTCTLYNACVISRAEFAARMERMQQLQLDVRRTLGAASTTALAAQQNIMINQPGPFGAVPVPAPGDVPPGGVPDTPSPPPPTESSESSGQPWPGTDPGQVGTVPIVPPGTGMSPGSPVAKLDAVLGILREGSRLLRGSDPTVPTPSPGQLPHATPPYVPPTQDLDARLRAMLTTLRQNAASRQPGLASGTTTVGNFAETGQPYSGPVGAVLQERVNAIVQQGGVFPATPPRTRGITVKQVAGVQNPNDPRALGKIYDSSIAIVGTYRPQAGQVDVSLTALDSAGNQLAQVSESIPAAAIPSVIPASPANAADTTDFLDALKQLGPKAHGSARVEVTTNRPGAGAAFRLGEEIRYFVTATMPGHLYLFHIDADKNVTRIFPNDHQRDASVSGTGPIEVPGPGAPFTFEASPPFGLETTLALITAAPLDEASLQAVGLGLRRPTPETLARTRGAAARGASAGSSSPAYVWNTVTVLVRP
ncbi:MAG TPA: DUF4384 domain-containing protein [Methylomirabilota bacterium]|nr:DUF4384 domain-containing protein [Methylomirabilota bacterium]